MEREGRSVDLVRTCRLDIITLIAHGHEEKKNGSPCYAVGAIFNRMSKEARDCFVIGPKTRHQN